MDTARAPKNHLLAALPRQDWERMQPHFKEVELPLGEILFEQGEPFGRLYFPNSGVVSTVGIFEDGSVAEMATTGREGMVGVAAILGSATALNRNLVEVPGSALVTADEQFRRFLRDIPAFHVLLSAYAQCFLAQVLQSVACNALHQVEERAARWLLMCHDRAEGDTIPLTQEYLAEMLGVSRATVNAVARTLQRAGLIGYRHGMITIRDRRALEEASCECYHVIRRQYEERLEGLRKQLAKTDP